MHAVQVVRCMQSCNPVAKGKAVVWLDNAADSLCHKSQCEITRKRFLKFVFEPYDEYKFL